MSEDKPETHASTVVIAKEANAVPPAGEGIHLPPGSAIPLMIALSITVTLVGLTVGWIWTILGGIGFVVALGMWIRDTIAEVNHLPDDLSQPGAHH